MEAITHTHDNWLPDLPESDIPQHFIYPNTNRSDDTHVHNTHSHIRTHTREHVWYQITTMLLQISPTSICMDHHTTYIQYWDVAPAHGLGVESDSDWWQLQTLSYLVTVFENIRFDMYPNEKIENEKNPHKSMTEWNKDNIYGAGVLFRHFPFPGLQHIYQHC